MRNYNYHGCMHNYFNSKLFSNELCMHDTFMKNKMDIIVYIHSFCVCLALFVKNKCFFEAKFKGSFETS